jgi:hypothetical protein
MAPAKVVIVENGTFKALGMLETLRVNSKASTFS